MHRRVGSAVVVVLAALLLWWATRPSPVKQEPDRVTSAPEVVGVPAANAPPAPVPAPSVEPVDDRPAKVAAIAALAEVSGRYAVVCPTPPDRDGTSWSHPEGATCALGGGIVCAASQPAGSVVIRHEEDGAPVEVYRWDTGPDGATTCVLEPPTEGRVRVRVVDAQGVPRAGVSVSISDRGAFATTDTHGEATLPIMGTGTHPVVAIGDDGAVSRPAGVVAGGTATLVLGDPVADIEPGHVLPELRMASNIEALEDLETALEGSPPPEVARELGKLRDSLKFGLDLSCETSATCRSWKAGR